jgi:hypothetical protein
MCCAVLCCAVLCCAVLWRCVAVQQIRRRDGVEGQRRRSGGVLPQVSERRHRSRRRTERGARHLPTRSGLCQTARCRLRLGICLCRLHLSLCLCPLHLSLSLCLCLFCLSAVDRAPNSIPAAHAKAGRRTRRRRGLRCARQSLSGIHSLSLPPPLCGFHSHVM